MTQVTKKSGKDVFKCEVCGFFYEEREYAEKCEAFCKEHKSCSMEITKYAIRE